MRRPFAALLALGAAAALADCGALDPYATSPEPAQPGQPVGPRVAICYNPVTTTRAEAQTQAQQQCAAGTHAEPVTTQWIMQYCPVLLPGRATFACTPGK